MQFYSSKKMGYIAFIGRLYNIVLFFKGAYVAILNTLIKLSYDFRGSTLGGEGE